ncbi:MAG: thioredoxin domain-containing protein, partial [Ilumatobacteraceae bacterium]
LQLVAPLAPRAPSAFANALGALALHTRGITEIAVAGDRQDLVNVVHERWRPRVVAAWGERYDSPLWQERRDGLAYVCEHYACQAPASTPDELRLQL